MIWLSWILAAVTIGLVLWDWNFRYYITRSQKWLRDAHSKLKDNTEWQQEADDILCTTLPQLDDLEETLAKRFIPYNVTMCVAAIFVVMAYAGITSPVVIGFLVTGVAYMSVRAVESYTQYVKTDAMLQAQSVVIKAKLNYDQEVNSPD